MDLEVALALLRRTPPLLGALLEGLPADLLDGNEGPDTFSPRDVVGHLIHGEETDWVPRIKLILEHGLARPFTPFDRFGFRERLAGLSLAELLDRFRRLRTENVAYVEGLGLGPERLESRGTHPELGPVTLGQLLATWVVHDLNHVGQIVRVMARQYGTEVGPWEAYLSILRRP